MRVAVLLPLLVSLAGPVGAQGAGPRVFISVDMEGIAGSVTGDQLGPDGFEYARQREFMTEEALAAVRAAKAAGAREVLVADAHGNGESLLFERFPKDVRIVRAWPRRFTMMAGVEEGFDAAVLIGYHASTDNPRGVRAHTFSSARIASLKLNGRAVSEGVFNAALAGHFGVPVVMISGDDVAVAEVRAALGDVETAAVKKALGFHSAATLTPEASSGVIAEAVARALGRLADFRPYRIATPVEVELRFKHYRPAEVAALLGQLFERTDSHTIRFQAPDMPGVSDTLNFLLNYRVDLEP